MSYIAYLCYPKSSLDLDEKPIIKFEEPEEWGWKYEKVIPIQFSVLHHWTDKDMRLNE